MSFPALGTTAVVIVDGDEDARSRALASVQAELEAIDAACSRFRPDSELCRLNAAPGEPFPAGELFLEAVAVALRAACLTDGLVDPTVGRALRQLGYDRDFRLLLGLSPRWPHPAGTGHPGVSTVPRVPTVLADPGPAPGWRVVSLDRERGTVTVPEGVELDLGATAKALAADRAAAAAHRATGRGTLVSLGGDVAVAGPAPTGGWSIQVTDDHDAAADAPSQVVTIKNGGLATSGTAVRRWRHGGQQFHHLIDPATGQPAMTTWRTVSVAAASCVDANTASTAAIVQGPAAPDWLAAHSLPGRLVDSDGNVTTVAAWPEP